MAQEFREPHILQTKAPSSCGNGRLAGNGRRAGSASAKWPQARQ
jgi:hypothetical protein